MSDADVVVVNAGSTSVKLSRFRGATRTATFDDLDECLAGIEPDAVVHRVVHGGDRTAPTVVDDAELADLRALTELAPLHQPAALDAIDRCRQAWGHAQQIACFDTAFHSTLPPAARTYPLPDRLRRKVRVYGFHGLSHAWSARQARRAMPGARRVLVAHLGGGQSLCGVLDGASVVTTMGFAPLDGLVMATRAGSVDPSAVLWLAQHTDEDLDDVLERQSGLLGLAGTADMRQVVESAARGVPDAALALRVWLHRFLLAAGGCVAVLGGLDALVFTGGIGEHSAEVRQLVAEHLGWLGVRITAATPRLDADIDEISEPGSTVRTFVIAAHEDRQMLDEAAQLLAGRQVDVSAD